MINFLRRLWNHPAVKWLSAFAWTGLIGLLTLTPGNSTLVVTSSNLLGGSDLTDGLGHTFLFALMGFLYFRAFYPNAAYRQALIAATGVGVIMALGTETAQLWVPNRGATIFDVLMNMLGMSCFWLWMIRRSPEAHPSA
jgi:VanZ family protein